MAEPRFVKRSGPFLERLARPSEQLDRRRWHGARGLQLAASQAWIAGVEPAGRGCRRLAGRAHPHHLFGDTACFLLVGVSWHVDCEFCLNPTYYCGRSYRNPAKIMAKAR